MVHVFVSVYLKLLLLSTLVLNSSSVLNFLSFFSHFLLNLSQRIDIAHKVISLADMVSLTTKAEPAEMVVTV